MMTASTHRVGGGSAIRGASPAPRRSVGFSLIELLVVIAVVALLVALALPGLSYARAAARDTACLCNHRQLAAAWNAYTDDYRNFPVADMPSFTSWTRFAWGGVDWFGGSPPPGFALPSERPLNLYVAGEPRIEFRAEVFRCPRDTGAYQAQTGARNWETSAGPFSSSGEITTCFGISGASYESNDWMYCLPGSRTGWSDGTNPPGTFPRYRPRQGPQHVQVTPSRFILLADIGPSNWVRMSAARRWNQNIFGAWWHGAERQQFAFLDGSARLERTGLLVCPAYSFHMIPITNPNTTWIRPGIQ